jgi:anti-sigma28 factor (negative regulator of flagellin synthesis)
MAQPIPTELQALKARIESGAYKVDAAKVAEKLVERLLEGRTITND